MEKTLKVEKKRFDKLLGKLLKAKPVKRSELSGKTKLTHEKTR